MRGVIVEGEIYGRDGDSERVLVFLELEGDVLHARRSYGERASTLTLELEDVEAAIAALKRERGRRPPEPIPGQTSLDDDDLEGEA